MGKKKCVVLGSTGMLGHLFLDLWDEKFQKYYEIAALIGHTQQEKLEIQSHRYHPKVIGLTQNCVEAFSHSARKEDKGKRDIPFLKGIEAINDWLRTLDDSYVLLVLNSGIELLPGILGAIQNGVDLLISNKEVVVCGGKLLKQALQNSSARLIPLDSEHYAIWQCLSEHAKANIGRRSLSEMGIQEICLTGSGGPFWTFSYAQLQDITPAMACKHPIWPMGKKNSVDSATFMNKGLEYIEASVLFGANPHQISVIRHPQAQMHGGVIYNDGSLLLQYAPASMRIPIESGLRFLLSTSGHHFFSPRNEDLGQFHQFFKQYSTFVFEPLELNTVPALRFAQAAMKDSDRGHLRFDALNTALVEEFLDNQLNFSHILPLFEWCYTQLPHPSLDDNSATERVAVHQRLKWDVKQQIASCDSSGPSLSPMSIHHSL